MVQVWSLAQEFLHAVAKKKKKSILLQLFSHGTDLDLLGNQMEKEHFSELISKFGGLALAYMAREVEEALEKVL